MGPGGGTVGEAVIDVGSLVFAAVVGAWAHAEWAAWRKRRQQPYTYRWECPNCDSYMDIGCSEPGAVITITNRLEKNHVCGSGANAAEEIL